MDEYQFQHEDDSDLKKSAHDAINRTLWLQHWRRHQAIIRRQLLVICVAVLVFAFLFAIPLPAFGLPVASAPGAWFYAVVCFGLLILAAWTTVKRTTGKWLGKEKLGEIKRPQSFSIILGILYYTAMIFNRATDFKRWHIGAYLPALLFILAWDLRHHRKLKRDMIAWGVLEADGSPRTVDSEPLVAQLEKSEQRIDEALSSSSPEPIANRVGEHRTTV